MGVSSLGSLFAIYLMAGNAFGESVKRGRRELLMVTDAIETRFISYAKWGEEEGERKSSASRTSILILEEQVSRIVEATSDIAHDGAGRRSHGARRRETLSQSAMERAVGHWRMYRGRIRHSA